MTEQLFFVRKRGEISGPYTVAQLHGLHARGLFARFNEVSVDQVHWEPAGSVAGLFSGSPMPAPAPAPVSPSQPPPVPSLAPSPGGHPIAPTVREQAVDAVEWFYLESNGVEYSDAPKGPVTLQELQRLLDTGVIDAATPACKSGMAEWLELGTLPELRMPGSTTGQFDLGQTAPGRPAASRRSSVLRKAAFVTPVAGVAIVSILIWAAVNDFLQDNQAKGVLFAFLALIVFLLSGVAAVLLAVLSLRQRTTVRKTGGPP
jgi:hypothetical protein